MILLCFDGRLKVAQEEKRTLLRTTTKIGYFYFLSLHLFAGIVEEVDNTLKVFVFSINCRHLSRFADADVLRFPLLVSPCCSRDRGVALDFRRRRLELPAVSLLASLVLGYHLLSLWQPIIIMAVNITQAEVSCTESHTLLARLDLSY